MFTFPKTTTIREIQRDYKKVFEEIKRTKQPIVVLKNNKPDIVLVDVQVLQEMDKKLEEFEIEDALRSGKQGMKEYKQGRSITAKSLLHLNANYWKNLWRMIEKSRSIKGRNIDTTKFIAEDRQRH